MFKHWLIGSHHRREGSIFSQRLEIEAWVAAIGIPAAIGVVAGVGAAVSTGVSIANAVSGPPGTSGGSSTSDIITQLNTDTASLAADNTAITNLTTENQNLQTTLTSQKNLEYLGLALGVVSTGIGLVLFLRRKK
jgi:hypothetical protein